MRIIRAGATGEEVRDVQRRLIARGARIPVGEQEGVFGPATEDAVRSFQRERGLPSDGIVGPDTWGALVEVGYRLGDRTLYLRSPMFRGDDVRELQRRLNELGFESGKEDGIFGRRTDAAVRSFQTNVAVMADGIAGLSTVQMLERLRPTVPGPSRSMVRERETMRETRRGLAVAVIAVDAGHGPDDPGMRGQAGTAEEDATLELARACARELERRGARAVLVRDGGETPAQSTRAEAANRAVADAFVSLHLGGEGPGEGATTYYWGTSTSHSPAGRRIAELVQERLVASLGLTDGRIHPLAVAVLRETRMPAVIVEPCFLSNPDEERRLGDPDFVQGVAVAIADALERYFEPESSLLG